jgi:5-formyltetrahydrofolate cyclo-ligase
MAWPRLARDKPFLLLDPRRIHGTPREAASIRGAMDAGREVAISQMAHLDLVVCGTVAVNRDGVRIGKGGGFSDLEFALLVEAGLVDRRTVLATTVHALQLITGDLPETAHDFRVDLIVTPEEVIRTKRRKRPRGIIWSDLDDEKIGEIPVLRGMRP